MFSIALVQASERRSGAGSFEADDGQHLVEPFENAGGNARRLLVEPAGEIAQESLGFVGIIELPGLPYVALPPTVRDAAVLMS
jgi:hypothetical protein